jgi:Rrf2 family protein
MQLTRAADYAVSVMVHLAGLPPGSRASRSELATEAGCPEQFLSKVLQNLTRSGLIISYRGNTGGFELPMAHRDASILQVVEAVEGPIHLNSCLGSSRGCSRQQWCPAHPVWADAQEAMVTVLQQATIDLLAARAAASPRPVLVGADR